MANKDRDNFLLFNPVGIVHYRNIKLFENHLKEWNIRCILNPKLPWFSDRSNIEYDYFYFNNGHVPKEVFDGVKALIVFSAQPRLPSCHLIQEAALRSIPVIAVEEVYQMMLEQGFVNEYFLPVDYLFACSEYEKEKFLELGVPSDVVEVTGCIFHYKSQQTNNLAKDKDLIKRLGLSENNRIATLSLAYLTPSGETMEIRRQLVSMISQGLPDGYELIIKPHPAEGDENINDFIKQYAPRAKVIDKYTPIEEVLSITDVLFNRGNSQVIIDALKRRIPVAVIPLGRKTLFHGFLDESIVNKKEDIVNILKNINKKGFILYNPIFERYLSITPEESVKRVMTRVNQIAEDKELYKPAERLLEISLFWAWMGYVSQALRTLSEVSDLSKTQNSLLERIYKLICYKADYEDLAFLKGWSAYGYREWLIKSLWIKSLYRKGIKITLQDKIWLEDFPPRMNREHFILYACMLCWCYLRSGMRLDCEMLINKLYEEYGHLKYIKNLKRSMKLRNNIYFDSGYWRMRLGYTVRTMLKNFVWELGNIKS